MNNFEKNFIDRDDVQVCFVNDDWKALFVIWLHEKGHELWQLPNTGPDGELTMEDQPEEFLTFCHRPINFKGA